MTDQWKDSDRYRQSPEGGYFEREMPRRMRRIYPPGVLEGGGFHPLPAAAAAMGRCSSSCGVRL